MAWMPSLSLHGRTCSVPKKYLHIRRLQAVGTTDVRSWLEDSSDEESKGSPL
ncbi:hypothetical protein AB4298_06530 [Shewanella sp. 10N.261.52.F9]|uniref:hypothetical protein n=1 Tax=Shewanella sp. 10N.261.52.F9 TaxID=3229684 RepID=UPI00354F88CE